MDRQENKLSEFPKISLMSLDYNSQVHLFCIKAQLNDSNRFLYINVFGSYNVSNPFSCGKQCCPGKPYKISPIPRWMKDNKSSRDCVLVVRLQLWYLYQLRNKSDYLDLMDKIVREWFADLNKTWKGVKGMDEVSKLEIDTTKNYEILKDEIEPTSEMISAQRYTGKHESLAAKPENIKMNSFLNMLKATRPEHCDWPKFTDETEMFCVQVTCFESGHSLLLNFLGTQEKDNLVDGQKYSPLYWRKGWPNFDLVAFVRVNRGWYSFCIEEDGRRFFPRRSTRQRIIEEAIEEYSKREHKFNFRDCLDAYKCNGTNVYSILRDGQFVEPSPCYAKPGDCLVNPVGGIKFSRQLKEGIFNVSVRLRRLPDQIWFKDDFVEIFDTILTPIAKFHLPIYLDLTQPLKYKWEDEERTLNLEFKVNETLKP